MAKLGKVIEVLERYKKEYGEDLDIYVNHMDSLEIFDIELIMPPMRDNRVTICFSEMSDKLRR